MEKTKIDLRNADSFVITDCGSTTTKAILILKEGDEFRLAGRGEAPTTVEAPFDDVTVGVITAITELQELTGRKLLDGNRIICPKEGSNIGVDAFLSTSSAGGGLQMSVAGVIKSMTGESAQRAALGAGAIIMDVLAIDDGRKEHEKIERIRHLRPDMFLLAGGTDGGTTTHLAELAATLLAADTKPRFGIGYKLPVIYAGNVSARQAVQDIIKDRMDLKMVDNIRPVLERENLGPAREAIHRIFLEHVMAQAPGYNKLMEWVSESIMPTPAAMGECVQTCAREEKMNVLAVDIGGATTDVFSVFGDVFNRTVSANYGLSYSICNVLKEAGINKITRWLPFEINEAEVRNNLRNKMIRPTTIPQTLKDLYIEQAIAREALRLSLEHHKLLAVGLKGVQQQRSVSDAFSQSDSGQTLVDMMSLGMMIGSGGVLSHAPMRNQSAMIIIDGFNPQGITILAVDSIFMMPHLGILSKINPKASNEVFKKDCLIYLGTAINPVGNAKKYGDHAIKITMKTSDGRNINESVNYGDVRIFPLGVGQTAEAIIYPTRNFDAGEGKGRTIEKVLHGGVVGIIIDCRGVPFKMPEDNKVRIEKLLEWYDAFGLKRAE